MPGKPWNDDEAALLKRLIESGKSYADAAGELRKAGWKRNVNAVRLKAKGEGWQSRWTRPSPVAPYADPLVVEGDALILSDMHCPFHDADWAERCMRLAVRWDVHIVGLPGDLIDMAAFSSFAKRDDVTFKEEVRATEAMLQSLAEHFDTIIYAPGNHEHRITRKVDYMGDIATFADMWIKSEKVRLVEHHLFMIVSGGERFRITHPKNASIQATAVPRKLCAKYNSNVISGHGHLVGMTRDDSGRFWAIDCGVMADPRRIDYLQLEDSTRPMVGQGCVIIKSGVPVLLTPQNIAFYETLSVS